MSGIGGRHIVELAKITEYLLNENHPIGRAKAAYFRAFGFHADEPQLLALALDDQARRRRIVRVVDSVFGTKREIRCSLETPDGRNPCIVAIWLQPPDNAAHRFITAYPAPSDRNR